MTSSPEGGEGLQKMKPHAGEGGSKQDDIIQIFKYF